MNKLTLNITRTGLSIMFIWIGVLVLLHPSVWGSFLQQWALQLLPVPLTEALFATAILDICIGILFLIKKTVWLGALLGFLHLISVLIVCGITDVTVRDVGLMFVCFAVFMECKPILRRTHA